MDHIPQIEIPAVYMQSGASKGVFFRLQDLPAGARIPGETRDQLLMRVVGKPTSHGEQMDAAGTAMSGIGKGVIVSQSARPCHDVDYLYGQISVDKPSVDWTGNQDDLSAAVGLFAISSGLLHRDRIPRTGTVPVRIWQANVGKTIVAHVPVFDGEVQQSPDPKQDGITPPTTEVRLEFTDPVAEKQGGSALFPTSYLVDELNVPGVGTLKATMINAGIPTIFVNAADIGYRGRDLQEAINDDPKALAMFELIRAHGAMRMGLIAHAEQAVLRQHTPKIAMVAPPHDHVSPSGEYIAAADVDVLVREFSMGKLNHATTDAVAVAAGTAAAIPGTVVNLAAGGVAREVVRIGQPQGIVRVRATARMICGEWIVTQALMSRRARVLNNS